MTMYSVKPIVTPGSVKFTMILAHDLSGNIGKEDRIPWHMPADLAHYAASTKGKPVIVGRKTYESLPDVALTKRLYVILTRDVHYEPRRSCDYVVGSTEAAIKTAEHMANSLEDSSFEVMVAGGLSVYLQFIHLADRAIVTQVNTEVEGDSKLPAGSFADWKLDSSQNLTCSSGLTGRISYLSRPKDKTTPCVGTCSCSQGDFVCRGCGRTDVEVRDWNTYCQAMKRLKMRQLHISKSSTKP